MDKALWIGSLKGSTCAMLVRRRSLSKKMPNNSFDYLNRSLFHLCHDHGRPNCIDPRDKIFGFHALTLECCAEAVLVDYSLSLFQISTRVLFHHGLSHSSSACIVCECRVLHDVLGISIDDGLDDISRVLTTGITLEKHYDPPLLFVRSNYSGLISFVNSISPQENTANPPPNLSYEIWENLYKFGKQLKQSSISCLQISTQLDLVFPIGVDVACSTDYVRMGKDVPEPAAIPPHEYPAHTSAVDKSYLQIDQGYHLYAFQQLLTATQNVVSPHSGLGIKLAFEDHGVIILAPSNVKVGDILCRFGSADMLAILRPSQETPDKHYLVGRAVALYPPLTSNEDILLDPELEIQIDVRILQLLVLVSRHPDKTAKPFR